MSDSIEANANAILPIVELVSFRLAAGVDPAAFLAKANATQPQIAARPGFLCRSLLCDGAGVWTDMVEWQSQEAAMRAAEWLMQDAEFLGFCAAIDMSSVKMQHLPMLWRAIG